MQTSVKAPASNLKLRIEKRIVRRFCKNSLSRSRRNTAKLRARRAGSQPAIAAAFFVSFAQRGRHLDSIRDRLCKCDGSARCAPGIEQPIDARGEFGSFCGINQPELCAASVRCEEIALHVDDDQQVLLRPGIWVYDRGEDRVDNFIRAAAARIRRGDVFTRDGSERLFHRVNDSRRSGEFLDHARGGPQGGDWIDNAAAGYVIRGAMNRLVFDKTSDIGMQEEIASASLLLMSESKAGDQLRMHDVSPFVRADEHRASVKRAAHQLPVRRIRLVELNANTSLAFVVVNPLRETIVQQMEFAGDDNSVDVLATAPARGGIFDGKIKHAPGVFTAEKSLAPDAQRIGRLIIATAVKTLGLIADQKQFAIGVPHRLDLHAEQFVANKIERLRIESRAEGHADAISRELANEANVIRGVFLRGACRFRRCESGHRPVCAVFARRTNDFGAYLLTRRKFAQRALKNFCQFRPSAAADRESHSQDFPVHPADSSGLVMAITSKEWKIFVGPYRKRPRTPRSPSAAASSARAVIGKELTRAFSRPKTNVTSGFDTEIETAAFRRGIQHVASSIDQLRSATFAL